MKTNKTLYISDLDGTLLGSSAKLSEYTKKSLNALIEKGMCFSVATARLLEPVQKMLDGVDINIPIILMNGVLIYDLRNQMYIKVNKLSPEIVNIVTNEITQHDVTAFMYDLSDNILAAYHQTSKLRPVDNYLLERIERYKSQESFDGLSSLSSNNIIYFTLIDTKERLSPIYESLSQYTSINQAFYNNVYNPDYWFLEVYGSESSKETAVNYLKETYKFNRVVSFGDNHNDLPMFQASDICIAVNNATTDIKNVADYICDSNTNDGVAKWLTKNYSLI